MTKPPVARICWVQEKVLRKREGVQSVHFWGWCSFQILYGWAEVWKEPLSCSPCLSQGWITAARCSVWHLTIPSSLFPTSTSQTQTVNSSGWQATFYFVSGQYLPGSQQRLFGANPYRHRMNDCSQMQYLLSSFPRINTTSWLKQFYPPSPMKRQL